eukprot:jgi/Botrbrau1/17399/Bobra.0911s0006.1
MLGSKNAAGSYCCTTGPRTPFVVIATLLVHCYLVTGEQPPQLMVDEQSVATQTGLPTLAIFPAEAPALSYPKEIPQYLPSGYEKYVEHIIDLERQTRAASKVNDNFASTLPVQAPEVQPVMKYDVAYTEIPNLKVTNHSNGSLMGAGTLRFLAANGSLLTQMRIAAPLVPQSSLKKKKVLLSFNVAASAANELLNGTVPTIERFEATLAALGVLDFVDKVKQVSVDLAGLPGVTALLLGCLFGIPAKSYGWVVTFKEDPGTVAFFFSATDFTVPENVVDDICFAPKPLITTPSYPCPPQNNWPCLVSQGFQIAFDAIRDQLLPAWRELTASPSSAQPRKIICSGHSLAGSMAALCSPFMKAMVPTADITFFGSAVPLTGNDAFEKFVQNSTVQSTNIMSSCDPFPSLPPSIITGYTAMQEPIWLVQKDAFNASSYIALAQFRPPGIYVNIFNHYSTDYLAALNSAIANAPP